MLAGLIIVAALLAVPAALALWSAWISRAVERLVPMDGRRVSAGGVEFHVVERGPAGAPAIVMVHGLLGQARNFTYVLADRLAADHRVLVIDRPGWGYSRGMGPRLGIAEQAHAVAALIDALGLERPLLVGHSMGGAVSLALALAHGDKVRGLALIAPYTQPVDRPPEPFKGLLVPRGLRHLVGWTLAVPIALRTGRTKTVQVFAPDPVPDDFPVRGGGALGIRPFSFVSGCHEIGIAKDAMEAQAPRYGEIRLPVAILYGRHDALLDPKLHGEYTASVIPGATIELLDGGHMLPITHADATEAWLREIAR